MEKNMDKYEAFISLIKGEISKRADIAEHEIAFQAADTLYEDQLIVTVDGKKILFDIGTMFEMNQMDNVPVTELARTIIESMQKVKDLSLALSDYEKVKRSLYVCVRNFERNVAALNKAICRQIGDIAIVLCLKVCDDKIGRISLMVSERNLQVWKMDAAIVLQEALVNGYLMSPPRIFKREGMSNLNYKRENFMDILHPYELDSTFPTILSTTEGTDGAVAVFLPGVADRLAFLMDSSFYIAFTSKHEAMIHSSKVFSTEKIIYCLKYLRTTGEIPLSDRVYYYDKDSYEFSVVND